MEKITDLYESCTTLGGMYNNFDEAVDVTKPKEMDAVIKAGSGFKDMSEITPEMIETFMRGKVDHINAVHDRTEEIEKKKNEERGERYGTYAKKYADEQKRAYFGMDDLLEEEKKFGTQTSPVTVFRVSQTSDENYSDFFSEHDIPNKKSEIEDIKGEINEIKEMMKLILSKQKNNNNPVVFDN